MIGTKVRFYVRPGQEAEGTITAVSHQADGSYPILFIDSAQGDFTRRSDDVTRQVTVMLHMDVPLSELDLAGMTKEIADNVSGFYGTVADWEYQEEQANV